MLLNENKAFKVWKSQFSLMSWLKGLGKKKTAAAAADTQPDDGKEETK